MAKLILKSPYIKSSGGAGGYLQYIATRERVELIPDDRPPTRKQAQLITKLANDFPDTKTLYEYEDYVQNSTKVNASAFITLALESNWDTVRQSDQYMKYIATRPRAERLGSHGLFGDEDHVDLNRATEELQSYTGNVWTHIISLKREDAARLGYDNAAAWRDLIRTHRNDIAAAMKIQPNDFRWYAAFHDEGEHPHCHMMAWSAKPGQAYLSRAGIEQIKSKLTNDIFKQEMLHLYEQKSASRNELVHEARKAMMELAQDMRGGICNHPEAEMLMWELSNQLKTVTGKKSYGYLPKKQKEIVDKIIDQMDRVPTIHKCYDRWLELQGKVDSYYHDKPQVRIPMHQQKELRAIKNAIIKEAERIQSEKITFEEPNIGSRDEPEHFRDARDDYWTLRNIIRNEDLSLNDRYEAALGMDQLAEDGDMYAQYFMGKLWRDGPLLIPSPLSARWRFEQAANQGHLAAQYMLAKLYLSNDLAIQNTQLGIQWLKIAAGNGSHFAQYRLGKEYLKGELLDKDIGKALECFTQSAEQGNQYAQYMLGKLYLMGKEVPYDKEQAVHWLTKAANQGNQYAQFFLDRQNDFRPPSVMLSVTRLLHHMGQIFQDNSIPKSRPGGIQIDRKRLQQLQEKRLATGHKIDDHEDQQWGYDMGMSM